MICPYCASDLSGAPRRAKEAPQPEIREKVPQPIFRMTKPADSPIFAPDGQEGVSGELKALAPPSSIDEVTKRLLITLLYFLLGSVFFLFSLALLFLSDGETLTLRWNSALWPLFLVLALPLIGLGLRSWSGLGDEPS